MKKFATICAGTSLAAAALLLAGPFALAQDTQDRPTLNKDKQPAQQPASTTLSLETPGAPPISSEEDTAFKTLQAMPEGSAPPPDRFGREERFCSSGWSRSRLPLDVERLNSGRWRLRSFPALFAIAEQLPGWRRNRRPLLARPFKT